jgi:hypothetical protein
LSSLFCFLLVCLLWRLRHTQKTSHERGHICLR